MARINCPVCEAGRLNGLDGCPRCHGAGTVFSDVADPCSGADIAEALEALGGLLQDVGLTYARVTFGGGAAATFEVHVALTATPGRYYVTSGPEGEEDPAAAFGDWDGVLAFLGLED